MFFRKKKSGKYHYLQIVENRREDGKVRQRVIATLGRLDELGDSGTIDALLASGSRFTQSMMVIAAHKRNESTVVSTRRIGAPMIFERLWEETGCKAVIRALLRDRKFGFDMERAVFLEVLHRLVSPGSDRDGAKWRRDYKIGGVDDLALHQSYRTMAWLGEELPMNEQCDPTPFSPRCTKDLIEEALFSRRRDLFTSLELVFFDTTSIYFEGEGGETLGRRGNSKDHRPDLKQMVVGAILDDAGRPVCCEMWPGNTTDVKSLIPVVDRLSRRFGIRRVCIVADRGMISKRTIEKLESDERRWSYILGARMRRVDEVKKNVLMRGGRYRVVTPPRMKKKDPSPLKVKDVVIEDRRYVVCHNEEQARKDRSDREAIVASLADQLKRGAKTLVGNKGYRKFLKVEKSGDDKANPKAFGINRDKIAEEARYDGKWVLRTNLNLPAERIALKYKQLLTVESLFRQTKSLMNTRPVFHKTDETIIGHVFSSFLALVLMKELKIRMSDKGYELEWADVIRDLDQMEEVAVLQDGKRFLLRTEAKGVCGKVFQAAGVALPPTVRQLEPKAKA